MWYPRTSGSDCFEGNEKAVNLRVNDNTVFVPADAETCPTVSTVCCYRCDLKQVLTCAVCDEKYHGVCVGLTVPVVTALLKIVSTTGWVCQSCRTAAKKQIEKPVADQRSLALEIAQIKNDVANLQQIVESSQQRILDKLSADAVPAWSQQVGGNALEWPCPQRSVAARNGTNKLVEKSVENVMLAKVHTELNDKQRRARNVLVRGLERVDGLDDLNVFASFCERNLPIKPAIHKCRRVGRTLPGKVQPLLVVLKSETAAIELLNCAPLLRTSTDESAKSVYINCDLTAAQALAAYQLRVARRSQREQQVVEQSPLGYTSINGTTLAVHPDFELSANAANFVPTSNTDCVVSCV